MELEKMKELCEKATKGPWIRGEKFWDGDPIMTVQGPEQVQIVEEPCQFFAYPSGSFVSTEEGLVANIDFIAASRTAIPELLAENAKLREMVEVLREVAVAAKRLKGCEWREGRIENLCPVHLRKLEEACEALAKYEEDGGRK